MKAPNRLFIKPEQIKVEMIPGGELPNVGIQYIRKDTLLEWLESKVYEHNEDRFDDGFNAALGQVIDKINTL